LGVGLGQGQSAKILLSNRLSVAEGAQTAPVLQKSAQSLGVDMPIVDAVCALLSGHSNVENVVKALLSRPLRAE
jgi:glycerol-3-phosphate dehydrogenase (NAD(P)+)